MGLGAAWCNELASQGLNIVSVDRQADALEAQEAQLRQEYGVEVRAITADLTNPEILDIVSEQTSDIEVGFLVYSAAMVIDQEVGHPHLFHEGSLEAHRQLLNINVKGVCELSYYFGGLMKERRRGGIVLISSGADAGGSPFVVNYGASKAYITTLGEGLWFEMRPYDVDVIAAPLGLTRTTAMGDFPDVKAMPAETAVKEILKSLGKRPRKTPGFKNSLGQSFMRRFTSRKRAIQTFANIHLNNFLRDNPDYDVYRN